MAGNTPQNQESDPADVHVGAKLQERREKLGLTQTEIAAALDVDVEQIERFERGEETVDPQKLTALATKLDVPVVYFFDDMETDEDILDADLRHLGDPPVALTLDDAFSQIEDHEIREKVINLAKLIADEK